MHRSIHNLIPCPLQILMSALPAGVAAIRMQTVRISLGVISVCVEVAMKEMVLSVQVCMIRFTTQLVAS